MVDVLASFLQFEVGLPIEVFRFDEGCLLLLIEVEQNDITGKILVFFHSYDMAHLDILPLSSCEANRRQQLNFTLILFLVAFSPSIVFNKILDHRDQNNQKKRYEDGRPSLRQGDGRDYLKDTY
jgi:hypothetical protein